jgi:RNA polymerase primary sigma factor
VKRDGLESATVSLPPPSAAASMNRLFKMAVMAGVESAVRLHIDRGDDPDCRDDKGLTPLMIAAARNKADICRLLLAHQADPRLVDPLGRDALCIARAAGATEAAQAIEAACSPPPAEDPTHAGSLASHPAPASPTLEVERASGEEADAFDLAGWEAEEDQASPVGDPTVAAAFVEIQTAISQHQPIDTSVDWNEFEAFLPDRAAPLPRKDDADARERLRVLLLRAIREGSVPRAAIEDLTIGWDGAPDPEACGWLIMVVNDLGAEADERFEYSTRDESFEVFVEPTAAGDEEEAVTDALAFVDDLGSGLNEPLRIYQRDLQREALLTAEDEVALSQVMESGVEQALDALAAWPSGIGAVLSAARAVASGDKPLRWLSSGEREESEGQPAPGAELSANDGVGAAMPTAADPEDAQEESDAGAEESADELAQLRAKAQHLSELAAVASDDGAVRRARRDALAAFRLTRGFLLDLADSAGHDDSARAFARALRPCNLARDRMAAANLKLVYSIAKKYLFSGQPMDDLLQEGNIGLIKAVDRYDWRRGFRFSTYATWWIRQQVGRFVADKGRTIRLPVHVYEKTQRIAQAARGFEFRHGHEPTLEEIAALVELPERKVASLLRLGVEPLPLHELCDVDSLVADHAKARFIARDPMEVVEDIQVAESVRRQLDSIGAKEARVVSMRYGIGVHDAMTLEEIGKQFDVTRERIRQIEAKALWKLKHPSRLDVLRLDLGLDESPSERRVVEVIELADASEESDEEDGEEESSPVEAAPAGMPSPERPTANPEMTERPSSRAPTALNKLLDRAREAGIPVEEYLEGGSRKICVRITSAPDGQSRTLIRKLIASGFQLIPGKGYAR